MLGAIWAKHFACQGGNVSLVRALVREHKADVSAKDYSNITPLQLAALYGKAEVVVSLIKEVGWQCELFREVPPSRCV